MNFHHQLSDKLRLACTKAVSHSLDALLPRACCLCEALGSNLCNQCQALFRSTSSMRCVRCGLKNACDCHLTEWTIDRTLVLTSYEAPIDSLIAELKFQSKQSIGKVLGDLMGREFADQLESERFDRADFCIVPVPLSAARFRQRGFNQAHTISKAVSRQLTIPIRHLVQRRRHQQSQSLLDREQRLANLNHAYELLGVPPDKVILIDDVMTTGATLNQCAALLKSAGTTHVWAMIAARTERPSTEVRR